MEESGKYTQLKERARFLEKMLEHPAESWTNARSRFMIKFVFFSHLYSQQRIDLSEQRLVVCRIRLEERNCTPHSSTRGCLIIPLPAIVT